MKIEQIAELCHQANKTYCELNQDFTQMDWEDSPDWQRKSAINGVKFVLTNLDAPASSNHDSWLKEKLDAGWKYGEIKDPSKKEHPCCVPYDKLPSYQKGKDYLFRAIVLSIYNAALVEPSS